MPSTRSSAATKCISEVPGLAKHTLTPPPTSVRTKLSAPFIATSPLTVPHPLHPAGRQRREQGCSVAHCALEQFRDGLAKIAAIACYARSLLGYRRTTRLQISSRSRRSRKRQSAL